MPEPTAFNPATELTTLYQKTGKHSKYQKLPSRLQAKLNVEAQTALEHYEQERLQFISKHLDVEGKRLLDVGGNTGYFSFELLDRGARQVDFYEGKEAHCEFVKIVSKVLDVEDRINIYPQYLQFEEDLERIDTDVMLLLNVLHHIGDDFGDDQLTVKESRNKIAEVLRNLSFGVKTLVFQIGYCWHGNRNTVLFEQGTKEEVINFVKNATESYWDIEQVGIAWPTAAGIEYQSPNPVNLERRNDLREFLNRPLFILTSRRYSGK